DDAAPARLLDLEGAENRGAVRIQFARPDPATQAVALSRLQLDLLTQGGVGKFGRADAQRLLALVYNLRIDLDLGTGAVDVERPAVEFPGEIRVLEHRWGRGAGRRPVGDLNGATEGRAFRVARRRFLPACRSQKHIAYQGDESSAKNCHPKWSHE